MSGSDAGDAGVRSAGSGVEIEALRQAYFSLGDDERERLRVTLGDAGLRRLDRSARKRRGPKRGRVVVIHGIMGSLLDSVEPDGDVDRVWVNVWRIMWGRMGDFKLRADGSPTKPGYSVRLAGLHETYMPLIFELDSQWDVLPFAFDWRLDLDDSANRLATAIRDWAGQDPVHVVAHSMGGLVTRRMSRLHPDLWKQMDDPDPRRRRGGRFVMLGTPNRGAYIIPLVFDGGEAIVKWLARIDQTNSRSELVSIFTTFPGLYQMLPAAGAGAPDDHGKLFDKDTWGSIPVRTSHLDKARVVQDELGTVLSPDRMIYVAGYDQETPYRIRIDAPGKFSYRMTQLGDGRVPHSLGLLDGVKTYWVRESHGSLPKNDLVVEDAHSLLWNGEAPSLETTRPVLRARAAEDAGEWKSADEVHALPPEADATIERAKKRGAATKRTAAGKRGAPPPETLEDARLRALITAGFLAPPAPRAADTKSPGDRGIDSLLRSPGRVVSDIPLRVEVVWGDIRSADGDVYCVGHYHGVVPQNAEAALDEMVSGPGTRASERVLTDLTRRGALSGELGRVSLFPFAKASRKGRVRHVAIVGMGHPGTFDARGLRRLGRSLAQHVGALPDVKTVCTVLIGSGVGGISQAAAARGLLRGVADALSDGLASSSVETLRLVEFERGRALELLSALKKLRDGSDVSLPHLRTDLVTGRGGRIGTRHALALSLAALGKALSRKDTTAAHKAAARVLLELPAGAEREQAAKDLERLFSRRMDVEHLARLLDVDFHRDNTGAASVATRISFTLSDAQEIRSAAITNTTTVSQRTIDLDFELVRELVVEATDPDPGALPGISRLLEKLLVHEDMTQLLDGERPLVLEVDREMASVHWEMLPFGAATPGPGNAARYIGLEREVARQLRTDYSPPPLPVGGDAVTRALVIGDPGDPAEGDDLPGAREEALAVADVLRDKGFDVTLLVGAPNDAGHGPLPDIPAARRLVVLEALWSGDYQIVHYCGHGDFDPEDPEVAGWLFKGGLVTAAELRPMSRAPLLVVANACLSGRTSNSFASGAFSSGARMAGRGERDLLPSLADEFFRQGVHNYVGTAWEVDDAGAVLFARTFYDALLPGPGAPGQTLGEATRLARKAVAADEVRFGALWAAYQLYGDPAFTIGGGGGRRGRRG